MGTQAPRLFGAVSQASLIRPKMCQQILSISRFLPQRVKDQIPPVQIAGNIPNSNILQWEFTGIQNCYAPDQSQFLFVAGNAQTVQQNCSQLTNVMWCCFLPLQPSPSSWWREWHHSKTWEGNQHSCSSMKVGPGGWKWASCISSPCRSKTRGKRAQPLLKSWQVPSIMQNWL